MNVRFFLEISNNKNWFGVVLKGFFLRMLFEVLKENIYVEFIIIY